MLLWVSFVFASPVCLPGQDPADAEHCCWPGQTWTSDGCTGEPTCPTGTTSDGTGCRSATRVVGVLETRTGAAVAELAPVDSPEGARLGGLLVRSGAASTVRDAVRVERPLILGDVDEAEVFRAIRSRSSGIRGCSLTEAASATLRLVVDTHGAVTTAAARDADPAAFGDCLTSAARTWTLPPAREGIAVITVTVAALRPE